MEPDAFWVKFRDQEDEYYGMKYLKRLIIQCQTTYFKSKANSTIYWRFAVNSVRFRCISL